MNAPSSGTAGSFAAAAVPEALVHNRCILEFFGLETHAKIKRRRW